MGPFCENFIHSKHVACGVTFSSRNRVNFLTSSQRFETNHFAPKINIHVRLCRPLLLLDEFVVLPTTKFNKFCVATQCPLVTFFLTQT